MTAEIKGFGFIDALKVERPQVDWTIENFLPKGFGFIVGKAKGGCSPHGGKSVFVYALAIAIASGKSFFGNRVPEKGKVLICNMDEMDYDQSETIQRMMGKEKTEGIYLTKGFPIIFPDDFHRLEQDIIELKPSVVIVDPLFKCVGGKDFKEQKDMGPILTSFTELVRKYGITLIAVHHCTKQKLSPEDKQITSNWLNGSIVLDGAWDFCFCLEYYRKENLMHLIQKYKRHREAELNYVAISDDKGNIHGIESANAPQVEPLIVRIKKCLDEGPKTVPELVMLLKASETSIKRVLMPNKGIEFQEKGKRGKGIVWGIMEFEKEEEDEGHEPSAA